MSKTICIIDGVYRMSVGNANYVWLRIMPMPITDGYCEVTL